MQRNMTDTFEEFITYFGAAEDVKAQKEARAHYLLYNEPKMSLEQEIESVQADIAKLLNDPNQTGRDRVRIKELQLKVELMKDSIALKRSQDRGCCSWAESKDMFNIVPNLT